MKKLIIGRLVIIQIIELRRGQIYKTSVMNEFWVILDTNG
jgi:hypothetical protein